MQQAQESKPARPKQRHFSAGDGPSSMPRSRPIRPLLPAAASWLGTTAACADSTLRAPERIGAELHQPSTPRCETL